VTIRQGYWLPPGSVAIKSSTTVNKCLRAEACTTSSDGLSVVCEAGHAGLLCGVCAPGYGQAAGACIACPPEGASHLLALSFWAVGLSVALVLTRKTLPLGEQFAPTYWCEWLRKKAVELCGCFTHLGLTASGVGNDHAVASVAGAARDMGTGTSKRRASTLAIARIFITYTSMTSLLMSFKLDWGSSLRFLFGVQKVLSGAMPPLLDCLGVTFVEQSVLTLLLPALIVLVPALPIALWHLPHLHIKKVLYLGGAWTAPGLTLWGVPPWQVLPNAVLTLSFLLWPSLVKGLLEIIDCSVVVSGVSYVVSDLTMRCDSSEHEALAGVATFYLATLVPAFPIGVAWLLQRNQGRLNDEAFSQRFSFLYVGYTQREYEGERHAVTLFGRTLSYQLRTRLFVWWECIVMARKFLLVAVTVWFGRDPTYQIYAGIWVLLIAYQLQVVCQPYEDAMMGRLESVSLCAVLVSLLIGNAIALGGLSPADETTARMLVAVVNLAVLVYFGVCFARSLGKLDRRLKKRQQQLEMPTITRAVARTSAVATNPLASGAHGAPDAAAHRSSVF
jgi:hypothetical protein